MGMKRFRDCRFLNEVRRRKKSTRDNTIRLIMKRMFQSNRRNKATPVSVSVKSLLFVVKFVMAVIHVVDMMKQNRLLFYLLAIVFLSGCKSGSEKSMTAELYVGENKTDSLDLSICFRNLETVRIDESEKLLDHVIKVKRSEDDIYVWDRSGLHRFSNGGRYICSIGNRGRGPNEYITLADFDVSGSDVIILDMIKKVLLYDSDGFFQSSAAIPFYASSCKLLDNEVLLSIAYQDYTEKFHVLSLPDFTEVRSYGECRENELTYRHFFQQKNYFLDKTGRQLYHELLNNTVYELSRESFQPVYCVNLWRKNPADTYYDQAFENVMDVIMSLNRDGYCYGLADYASDGVRHIFSYSEMGKMMFAYYNEKDGISVQSPNVYFPGVFHSINYSQVSLNFNSFFDISMSVPAEAMSVQGNPCFVFLSFF